MSTPSKGERRRIRQGLAALAIAVTGLTVVVTGAVFTDNQTIGSNAFTTGTVKLGVAPATTALTLTAMAPGDSVTAPITVTNTGTLAERYSLLSTTDATDANILAAQLTLTVKTGVVTCTTAGFSTGGVSAYSGVLGSTTGTKVFGNATQGADVGDRVLAAGANEVLCAQVTLPLVTGNAFQNKTTTATFLFNAEQTANN